MSVIRSARAVRAPAYEGLVKRNGVPGPPSLMPTGSEREYLVRICDFGSKRIGLDRVFMKVWLGAQIQESEPKNPSPGLATEESKRRNPSPRCLISKLRRLFPGSPA